MGGDRDHAVAEAVRDLLAGLVRAAVAADPAVAASGRGQARRGHERLRTLLGNDAIPEGRLDGLWTAAVRAAEAENLPGEPTRVSLSLQNRCPITSADLTGPVLDCAALEERVRGSAATG